jgi:hypothetical protein
MSMKQGSTVISNWRVLIDDFSTSGLAFYQAVEATLRERQVPGVTFERILFKEGGPFTAKRELLRVERDRTAFDIYAALYGSGYFFTWRLLRLGPKHPVLYKLGFLLTLLLVPQVVAPPFGTSAPLVWLAATVVIALVGLAFLARRGVLGSEERIMRRPVVGWIYGKLFNPITYYTLDSTRLFQESVSRAVNDVIDGLLTSQGLQALSEEAKRPFLQDATAIK